MVTVSFVDIMAKLNNIRQERFCQLYALHGNASRAARGAGYSERSARQLGSRLLTDPVVSARILQISAGDAEKLATTKEQALAELDALVTFNPQDLYDDDGQLIPIQDLPRPVAANIREIKRSYDKNGYEHIEVKGTNDKRAAIDMVLRLHNAYEDHERAGKGEVHIHLDDKDLQA